MRLKLIYHLTEMLVLVVSISVADRVNELFAISCYLATKIFISYVIVSLTYNQ